MSTPPSDPPSRSEEFLDQPREDAAESDARAGDGTDLAYLIRLQEAFTSDVTRFEAAVARGDGRAGLYEQLLRVRRISRKLDNRIRVFRLQRRVRAG